MQEQEVFAYAFEGTRHDAGTTMGWLKASLELALDREEFARRAPRLPGRARPAVTPAEPIGPGEPEGRQHG